MMFEVPSEPLALKPVAAQGARPAVHPARRPRAERVDLDRAPGRFDRRQSVCVRRRRRRRAVGPGAWRRQRGRAEDARRDRQARATSADGGRQGQGQGIRLPPDGLRPPRLQELRSAREDHPRDDATRCWPNSASTIRCWKSRSKLEEAALKDDYFIQRKLYPNVDFYSGIIYKALGIPTEMFTVMFAIARTAGWVAHWLEQQNDPDAQDRPSAADLHRPRRARLRRHRQALMRVASRAAGSARAAGFRPAVTLVAALVAGDFVGCQQSSQVAQRDARRIGFSSIARQRRLAQGVVRQHGQVERSVLRR